MSLEKTKFFYNEVLVDDNLELDYLSSKFHLMELTTIDTLTVGDVLQYRPDLISNLKYGSYSYGWLIAHHNGMLDPVLEFTSGKIINIPSLDDYYRFYNRYARKV